MVKKFICKISGIKFDDYDSTDNFKCFLGNFAMTLYNLNFGLICVFLLFVIILISIFGGIKQSYRWFILNQAFWDLLLCYSYICANDVLYFIGVNLSNTGNFCSPYTEEVTIWKGLLIDIFPTNPYSALLLLSVTRFLALYYMNLYERLTSGRNIIYLIFIFNFLILLFHINILFSYIEENQREALIKICLSEIKPSKNSTVKRNSIEFCKYSSYMKDSTWQFWNTVNLIFDTISMCKPLICLSLSIIATIFIIYRIARQAAFQLKHNRRDFMNSLRVSIVIILQIIINLFCFIIEFFGNIEKILESFWIIIGTEDIPCSYIPSYKCIDLWLPLWFNASMGLTDSPILQAIVQIRIFLESIIVLSIMTGYREAIFKFIKNIFKFLRNPKKTYVNIKSSNSMSQIAASFK